MGSDINSINIVGRLTRNAELKYTNSGFAITNIGLATNRSVKQNDRWTDEANFFDVVLLGKRGESLSQYLTKGTQIAVNGELKQDRWEQDGQKRSRVVIIANNIQLLGSNNSQQDNNSRNVNNDYNPNNDPRHNYQPSGNTGQFEDDIPF